ncbi:MAG TPA: nucleotidyltransferase family protein [Dehalococcoidia bacterium]|nr:nucleotidyltransferase family protein [Dehalococcoidia bacterium]
MSETVAILLAAGESRRMGQLKALLPWQGTSLLAHQVEALCEAGVDRVVVVLGHRAEELEPVVIGQPEVVCVVNPDYLKGKTTSIKTGVKSLRQGYADTLLLLNVDQPRAADTIRKLLYQHHISSALITIPTYQGKGGHPIVLDASLIDELLSIQEETLGLKAVTERHQDRVQRVEMDDPEVLWDLNTPEQYREALSG